MLPWNAPPFRLYSYPGMPPVPVTCIVPSSTLQSVASVGAAVQDNNVGSETTTLHELAQSFASLTVTI